MSGSVAHHLNTAGNGAIMFMLAIAIVFFSILLRREWNGRDQARGWRSIYTPENKAAVAMMTIACGLALKIGSVWWPVVLRSWDYDMQVPAMVPNVAGTLVTLWGFICLMRALSRYDWSRRTWLWLAGAAILFGVLAAM